MTHWTHTHTYTHYIYQLILTTENVCVFVCVCSGEGGWCSLVSFVDGCFPMEYKAFHVTFNILALTSMAYMHFSYSITNKSILNGLHIYVYTYMYLYVFVYIRCSVYSMYAFVYMCPYPCESGIYRNRRLGVGGVLKLV